jgi:hypothetical protein
MEGIGVGISLLLVILGVLALFYKEERRRIVPLPVREPRTFKWWVVALLFVLALFFFAGATTPPDKAEKKTVTAQETRR